MPCTFPASAEGRVWVVLCPTLGLKAQKCLRPVDSPWKTSGRVRTWTEDGATRAPEPYLDSWRAPFLRLPPLESFPDKFFDAPTGQTDRDVANPGKYGFEKESGQFHRVMVRARENEKKARGGACSVQKLLKGALYASPSAFFSFRFPPILPRWILLSDSKSWLVRTRSIGRPFSLKH